MKVKKLRLIASIFALLAMITIFFNQMTWSFGDPQFEVFVNKYSFIDVAFGIVQYKGTIMERVVVHGNLAGLFGYLFIFIGGLLALLSAFKQKKYSKNALFILDIVINLLILTGGILLILQRTTFLLSNKGYVDEALRLTAAPVIGASCAFAGVVSMVCGIIIDK